MKIKLTRILFVSTLLAGTTFFASCDEDTGLKIDVPQTQEAVYMIEPLSSLSLSKIDTVSSNLDSVLSAQGATKEDIDGIKLTGLSLSFTDKFGALQTNQNFNNIKSIGINISELTGSYTNLAALDSATMFNLYRNMNPIVFPNRTEPLDLLPFVSKPSFRVQLDGKIYNPTTDTMYIKSTMTITVGLVL